MKQLFIFITLGLITNFAFSQSKKEQITQLTTSIDSLKVVLVNERNVFKTNIQNQDSLIQQLKNQIISNKTEIKKLKELLNEKNQEYNNLSTEINQINDLLIQKQKEIEQLKNQTQPITKDKSSIVMLGTWVGEMGGKTLTIVIEQINQDKVIGYNILGTNKRPLKGMFTNGYWAQSCSKSFDAILNEPGDNSWDGVFKISFVGYEDTDETEHGYDCKGNLKGVEAIGTWESNNGKLTREIYLEKKN